MTLEIGMTVKNFNTIAKVVGFFKSADGAPSGHDGDPILREIGPTGKVRGGKWVADPTKCEIIGR